MRVLGRVRARGSSLVVFGASDSRVVLILLLCPGRIISGWRDGCFVSCIVPEEPNFCLLSSSTFITYPMSLRSHNSPINALVVRALSSMYIPVVPHLGSHKS